VFGLLNINKPAGITSRDVVTQVQRLVRPHKAGHAGTLDPLATGVLVVCLGRATRLVPLIQAQPKVYRTTFLLGRVSESHDLETDVEIVADAPPISREQLDAVLPEFGGRIEQVPPQHSAVRIGGRRAYQLARRGEDVEITPRIVEIQRIDVLDFSPEAVRLEIECGSGTYIRSLARDLGERLGCGAVMSELERNCIGSFRIEAALPLRELTASTLEAHRLPASLAVAEWPQVTVDSSMLHELAFGRTPRMHSPAASDTDLAVLDQSGELVALARVRDGRLHPSQVFVTPDELPKEPTMRKSSRVTP
jgi:tRNA pseudouridine55 synthase